MPTYNVTGKQLANAFDRAAFYMKNGYKEFNKPVKIYTITGAINFSVGHDKTVMWAARGLLRKRLDGLNVVEWLIKNGVPEADLKGLQGMKNLRSWRTLWAQKLADEFAQDPDHEYEFNYPF